MPSNFNINLRKNSIPVFDNNFIISQSKFEDNGITMMKKLLQSKIYFLKAEFKDFLQSYISILESLCIENCIEIVYRQYTSDYLKFYGLEKTDFVLNFNLLNEEEKKMIDLNEHSISLNYFIQDVFFSSKSLQYPFLLLSKILQEKFILDDIIYKNYIYTYIKKTGLNLGFHQRSKPFCGKSLLFILNLKEKSVNAESWAHMISDLENETIKYLQSIKCPARSVNWTEAEKIRVLNGMMRYCYKPNIFPSIYEDIIYGLYHTRPVKNALWDGVRSLFTKKINLKLLIEAVQWEPEKYPLDNHLKGVEKTSSFFDIYSKCYDSSLERFRHVTKEDLYVFKKKYLKPSNITERDFEKLL
jgi:hypothetical protein